MPIIHNVEQGSDEWHKVRLGIPTASEFDKIITPTGDPSKQWESYANKLLGEEMLGRQVEGYKSAAMQEGNDREAESVLYYEMIREIDTTKVGFVTDDARTMGCSPDRFIGDDGILEAKNPEIQTHIGYLIDGKVDRKYWPQLQGQLLITGRKWVDIMSYFPELPEKIIRVGRDGPYIEAMERELKAFNIKLQTKRQKLIDAGYLKGTATAKPAAPEPKKDKWTVLVDNIIAGLSGLNKEGFNTYTKKRSEEISNITLSAPTEQRERLAKALNDHRKGLDAARMLSGG